MSLVTGKVRFSYVNIFEPRAINGGEEKYSITILIPKQMLTHTKELWQK